MKEYTVEVEIRAWAKVSVVAQNGEEAIEAACDMVNLDDVYDWEVEDCVDCYVDADNRKMR